MRTSLGRSLLCRVFFVTFAAAYAMTATYAQEPPKAEKRMYGLIGKIITVEGKRDEFIAILLRGTHNMPGCLSYVVAKDPASSNAIWVTEVWADEASHKASLSLPEVRNAIAKGRPLIAKFEQSIVTEPIGGFGLSTKRPAGED